MKVITNEKLKSKLYICSNYCLGNESLAPFLSYMYESCDFLEIAQAQPCPLLASETLTGVTQLKIGDVCLFMYMFGRTYVILYFDPLVLLC